MSTLASAALCPGWWTGPHRMEREFVELCPFMDHPADMAWIETRSGRRFYPLRPAPDGVDLTDIAHALSMKCRFSGHSLQFYSVAQHSVLASRIVPEQDALWALLHDAAEAYLPDVARPIKPFLEGFREIEDRLLHIIIRRFGLEPPMPESVKVADRILLATERRDLMTATTSVWRDCELGPMAGRIVALPPGQARTAFLERAKELALDKLE